jgi:hypothetical protein
MTFSVLAALAKGELSANGHAVVLEAALKQAGTAGGRPEDLEQVFASLSRQPWPGALLGSALASPKWALVRLALVELSARDPERLVKHLRELKPSRQMSVLRHQRLSTSETLLAHVATLTTGAKVALLRAHPEVLTDPAWTSWLVEARNTNRVCGLLQNPSQELVQVVVTHARLSEVVALSGRFLSSAAEGTGEVVARIRAMVAAGGLEEPERSAAATVLAHRWRRIPSDPPDLSELELLEDLGEVSPGAEELRARVLKAYGSATSRSLARQRLQERTVKASLRERALGGEVTHAALALLREAPTGSPLWGALVSSAKLTPRVLLDLMAVQHGSLDLLAVLEAKGSQWRCDFWHFVLVVLCTEREPHRVLLSTLGHADEQELRTAALAALKGRDWSSMALRWYEHDPAAAARHADLLRVKDTARPEVAAIVAEHLRGEFERPGVLDTFLTLGPSFEGTVGDLVEVASELS